MEPSINTRAEEQIISPVDVDDRDTWPPQVVKIVNQLAKQCKGSAKYTCDLALPSETENNFRELLSGCLLRAYHCTRFLPHEVRLVRKIGLRLLSADLINDRIDAALKVGEISSNDAKILRVENVFSTGEQRYREDKVCLILSKTQFQCNYQGCVPLLENWGGEGVYMSSKAQPLPDRLKNLGKPTIVIALLDLGGQSSPHMVFPALHKVFVGAALRLSDVGADVHYKAIVPPKYIERFIHPGDPDYESLGDLPS